MKEFYSPVVRSFSVNTVGNSSRRDEETNFAEQVSYKKDS